MHRVELRVLTYNARAIACCERCGFAREGIERESAWVAGERQSHLVMGILEQEYWARSATTPAGDQEARRL